MSQTTLELWGQGWRALGYGQNFSGKEDRGEARERITELRKQYEQIHSAKQDAWKETGSS